MKVENVKISKIRPYPNNPRKNDGEAVTKVAESIRQFGFQQPIVVDKNMVVIVGHTRLKAAKRLGLKEVPVVVADGLTDDQVKAYRLADNKVGELAQWDDNLLAGELKSLTDIADFDMVIPGFEDLDEVFKQGEESREEAFPEDDRDPSCQHNAFENQDLRQYPSDSFYGMPEMEPTQTAGDKLLRFMDFGDVTDAERKEYIAHFYYDDYKFIAAWRDPKKYLDKLRIFKAVISPDFSLYTDFPRALQILSCYRRQWCGRFWQEEGIDVIPDVVWGDRDSYEYCFDGIPAGGTVAVSTVGVKNNPEWNGKEDTLFLDGYNEMMKRLNPKTVIVYGDLIQGLTGNIIRVPSYYGQHRAKWRKEK